MSNTRKVPPGVPVLITVYHYHAELACGDRVSFDMRRNLFVDGVIADPEADVQTELPCPEHGKTQTVWMTMVEGRGPCEECT